MLCSFAAELVELLSAEPVLACDASGLESTPLRGVPSMVESSVRPPPRTCDSNGERVWASAFQGWHNGAKGGGIKPIHSTPKSVHA